MSTPAILDKFPNTTFHAEARLVTWHPTGIFDAALAESIVAFLEEQERVAGISFNRYTDFDGISEVRLHVVHAFRLAERRRASFHGSPVRSALFGERTSTHGLAKLYEELMHGAQIEVRAFRSRQDAAEWLDVPIPLLDA